MRDPATSSTYRRSCRTRKSTPATSRSHASWSAADRSRSSSISIFRTSNPIPRKCTGSTTSIRRRKADAPGRQSPNSERAYAASVEAGKTQDFRRIVLVGVAEADVAMVAQHQLLAAQRDLGFVLDDNVSSVRAVIDEHELVATPLDAGVHARGFAIGEHDVVGEVAADRELRHRFRELDRPLAVLEREMRRPELDVRRERGQFVLGLLPDQLEKIDVLLLALDGVR